MGFGRKLTISFILLFVIGALCGAALVLIFRGQSTGQRTRQFPQSAQQWEDAAIHNLTTRLNLDSSQQNQARAAIRDVIKQIRSKQREQQTENATLFDNALQTLYPMLNSAQQHKLDVFRQHRKEALERRLSKSTQ
jgi:gas vesicle protein